MLYKPNTLLYLHYCHKNNYMWGEGTSYKYAAGRQEALSTAPWTACQWLRDGPLENLWGEASEVQKKHSRKGKLNEKKFIHAN